MNKPKTAAQERAMIVAWLHEGAQRFADSALQSAMAGRWDHVSDLAQKTIWCNLAAKRIEAKKHYDDMIQGRGN